MNFITAWNLTGTIETWYLLKSHFGIGVRKFAAYGSPQGYAYACLKIM